MRSILLLLLPGAVAVLMQDPGTTLVTATTGENSSLTLACAGPKAAMTKILFASYGTPTGMGLSALIAPSCHSDTSIAVVETYCLQQPACNLRAHNDDFGDPCFGVGKRLTVTAECGLATQTIEPDAGAVVLAQNASENRAISLACDAPLVIARILFASYGTPTNVGLYAAKGKCDAANSTDVVSTACLSKAGCTVSATSSLFGNPCPKFDKQLTVTAECAASVISPTAAPYTSGGSAQGGGNTSPTTSATPMIIGVVCGIIVLVLCCVAGGIAWRRRSKPRPASPIYHSLESTTNRSEPKPYTLISNDTTGPSNPTTGPQDQGPVVRPFDGGRRHIYPSSFINLNVQPLLYHRLVLEDLRVTSKKPLASGAYGEVWLGVYGGQQVAIKRLKQRDPRSVQKFIEEIVLMSQLDSDYVIRFVGASWTRPIEIECVVEYMDLGDLRNYLMTTRPGVLTWSQKYDVILSVIHGLVYLHTFKVPIIHRDLKSRNILLDSVKGTKLTDFGTSRAAEADDTMTTGIGTYQWMAPEIVAGTSYTAAADIYSFGIVLSELCTHKVPYADLRHPKTGKAMQQHYILHEVCEGRLHPTFDGVGVPTWVPEVAKQCLQLNDVDRPTALALSSLLSEYRQSARVLLDATSSE